MAQRRKTIRGKRTRVDLSRVQDCFLPWQEDAFGHTRPPFVPALARLCADMSADLYDLDIERWLQAGWGDGSFQAERQIITGFSGWSQSRVAPSKVLRNRITLQRARSHMHFRPIGDTLRALQQIVSTNTGKVLILVYPAGAGRFVVAVCFMGTSKKFYDWFTNLKISHTPDGLHEGFAEICKQFESNAGQVHFPEMAATLGLSDLTLTDILSEARSADSRFRLLVTGHSQGGAVSQCYVHRLIHHYGVRPINLVCYTLAAPTVVSAQWQGDPAAYPIYNIINSDDYIPRTGACMRLGLDLVYHPDDAFRHASYIISPNDPDRGYALGRLTRILQHVEDTPSALEAILALCTMLEQSDKEVGLAVLTSLNIVFKYLPPALNGLGLPLSDLIHLVTHQLTVSYQAVYQAPPPQTVLHRLEEELHGCLTEVGPSLFTDCLLSLLFSPHHISSDEKKGEPTVPAYIAIVRQHTDQLRQGRWQAAPKPCVVDAAGEILLPLPRLTPTSIELSQPLLLDPPKTDQQHP